MTFSERIDVEDAECEIVLLDDVRRCAAGDDLAKDARHGRLMYQHADAVLRRHDDQMSRHDSPPHRPPDQRAGDDISRPVNMFVHARRGDAGVDRAVARWPDPIVLMAGYCRRQSKGTSALTQWG